MTLDISEILSREAEALETLLRARPAQAPEKLAFHAPCTLQHGLRIRGTVERLLEAAGYELTPVADSHLCCGSAGDLFLLQPALSKQLRSNKLAALEAGGAGRIASANIGCISHLEAGTATPVVHWGRCSRPACGRGSEMRAVDEACPVAATRLASTLQTVSARGFVTNAVRKCRFWLRTSAAPFERGWRSGLACHSRVFRRCPIGGRSESAVAIMRDPPETPFPEYFKMALSVETCVARHTGDRTEQQDRVGIFGHASLPGMLMAVVADGMVAIPAARWPPSRCCSGEAEFRDKPTRVTNRPSTSSPVSSTRPTW